MPRSPTRSRVWWSYRSRRTTDDLDLSRQRGASELGVQPDGREHQLDPILVDRRPFRVPLVDSVELQDLWFERDVGEVGVEVHHEPIEDEAALGAHVDLVVGRELLVLARASDDRRPAPGVEVKARAHGVAASQPATGDQVQDMPLVPVGATEHATVVVALTPGER